MSRFDSEIGAVLDRAAAEGLQDVEIYARAGNSLSLRAFGGELESFQLSDSVGLGVRVLLGERVGYASTENMSPEAVTRALHEARANAQLVEDLPGMALPEPQGPGAECPPIYNPSLEGVALSEKIAVAKALESAAKAYDPRVKTVPAAQFGEGSAFLRIASSRGMDIHYQYNMVSAVCYLLAGDGHDNKAHHKVHATRDFGQLDPVALACEVAAKAIRRLGAREIASGHYPVVMAPVAMANLLSTYAEIFSARNAQEGKSLLANKLGQEVASGLVHLVDDPCLPNGLATRPFDDEGVSSRPLTLLEAGTFHSFLHNTQTARRAGQASTGHAARGSYKGVLGVAPSNLYLRAGESPLPQLVASAPKVVMITDLQGLHAGTNTISGDFSLAAQGFLFEGGEEVGPVHNFTVAGNFFDLLLGVEGLGNDLEFFPHGAYIGCPSVLVKELAIAGGG